MTPLTATPIALPTCCAVERAPETDPALAGVGVDEHGRGQRRDAQPLARPEHEQAGQQGGHRIAGPGHGEHQGHVARQGDQRPGGHHRAAEPMVSAGARSEVAR